MEYSVVFRLLPSVVLWLLSATLILNVIKYNQFHASKAFLRDFRSNLVFNINSINRHLFMPNTWMVSELPKLIQIKQHSQRYDLTPFQAVKSLQFTRQFCFHFNTSTHKPVQKPFSQDHLNISLVIYNSENSSNFGFNRNLLVVSCLYNLYGTLVDPNFISWYGATFTQMYCPLPT